MDLIKAMLFGALLSGAIALVIGAVVLWHVVGFGVDALGWTA